jgi:hypothetical protein
MKKRAANIQLEAASEALVDVHCARLVVDGRTAAHLESTLSKIMTRPLRSADDAAFMLRAMAVALCRWRYAWLAAGVASRSGIHSIGAQEQLEAWLEPVATGDVVADEPAPALVTVVVATAAGAQAPWHAASCEDVREALESLSRLRARNLIAINAAVHTGLSNDDVTGPGQHDPVLVRERVIIEIDLARDSNGPLLAGAVHDASGGRCSA